VLEPLREVSKERGKKKKLRREGEKRIEGVPRQGSGYITVTFSGGVIHSLLGKCIRELIESNRKGDKRRPD